MTEPMDQRKHLYDSEDSAVYFLEGLVMDQREDLHAIEKERNPQERNLDGAWSARTELWRLLEAIIPDGHRFIRANGLPTACEEAHRLIAENRS